jgi:hypothetical protein
VDSFHWTNRKRRIERAIHPGLKVRLQLDQSKDPPELQAAIHGKDQADRPYTTPWFEIGEFFAGLEAWASGTLLQSALPFVDKGDREFIKTGMSPRDWHDTFGEDD